MRIQRQRAADALNVVYTPRSSSGLSAHTEKVFLHVTAATEKTLADIHVETTAEATHSIETLDKALEVSSAPRKLGAIQNSLQHNIDNLSKSAMLTEQSLGRVIDADFATETSNPSKQQILNGLQQQCLPRQTNLNSLSSACCNKQLSRLFDAGEHKSAPLLLFLIN